MHTYSLTLILAGLLGILSLADPGRALSQTEAGKTDTLQALSIYLEQDRKAGDAWAVRKQLLVRHSQSAPTSGTSLREDEQKAAITPANAKKAILVFHQLRKTIGEDNFGRTARELLDQRAAGNDSWDRIKTLFEKGADRDLSGFFSQWLDRKGLPDLRIENASTRRNGSRYEVSFDVVQKGEVYALEVPFFIAFPGGGGRTETVNLDAAHKHVVLVLDQEPSEIVMDPDYDLPRTLSDDELPPLLSTLLYDEKPVIAPSAPDRDRYAPLIEALKQRGAEERDAAGIRDSDIKTSSFLAPGSDNALVSRLFGTTGPVQGEVWLRARKNPWNPRKVVVIARATGGAMQMPADVIERYGDFSEVWFSRQGARTSTEGSLRGVHMELRAPAVAIDLSTVRTLDDAIKSAAGKRIVYIGEYHDQHAHHAVQLEMIKSLYQQDRKLAIGMEMFQRPFQKVLDDYVAGVIDERAFLKGTEYFKRWVFDYNLYKPILDFAREKRIPVIALNQRKEITEKVSKSGLDALTDEERKDLPQQMDFSDTPYRERLKAVFDQHKGSAERNFDFFYQAQVLWDETMALSLDEFIRKNPDHRVTVIAGGGHLAYGSGIPKRAFRRNALPYFIVLNDGDVDRDIAHYLIMPEPLEGVSAPKLMAALMAENGQVRVIDLPEDSVSRKAGIRTGDRILSLDNQKVESVEDIKLFLFYKKPEETVNVKVLRKRLFPGDRELDFAVIL